jgi:TIR domain-containing protein
MSELQLFISYRRDDSKTITGRIHDHLTAALGTEYVFKDVDSIPLGVDFREAVVNAIKNCKVMLVIIGNKWLTLMDQDGNRRLDILDDPVRIEIEEGMKNANIRVIPILVNDAAMPKKSDLPVSISDMAFLNAIPVRDDPDFRHDIDRLLRKIKEYFPDSSSDIDYANKLIRDNQAQPQLEEYLHKTIRSTFEKLKSPVFLEKRQALLIPITLPNQDMSQMYEDVSRLYLEEIRGTLEIMRSVARRGNDIDIKHIVLAMKNWMDNEEPNSWKFLPSFFLMYTAGMTAINERNWKLLYSILLEIKFREKQYEKDTAPILEVFWVRVFRFYWEATRRKSDYELSNLLFNGLKPIFEHYLTPSEYIYTFDLFETFLAVVYLRTKPLPRIIFGDIQFLPHLAVWNERSYPEIRDFWFEGGKATRDWRVLKAGFFGNPDDLANLLQTYDKAVFECRNLMPFEEYMTMYSSKYKQGLDLTSTS